MKNAKEHTPLLQLESQIGKVFRPYFGHTFFHLEVSAGDYRRMQIEHFVTRICGDTDLIDTDVGLEWLRHQSDASITIYTEEVSFEFLREVKKLLNADHYKFTFTDEDTATWRWRTTFSFHRFKG